MQARPRLLCLIQLAPPIHGVTAVNQIVASSTVLSSRFEVEVLPLASAASFEEMKRVSIRKLGRMLLTSVRLCRALLARPPLAVYFTLTPAGAAFYRDCVFVAIMQLAGVPRIYHLHGTTAFARVQSRWKRLLHRWAFRDAWVIHLSPLLVADLEHLVPRERVLVVPNGVAEGRTVARLDRRGPARLLYLSNLTRTKGPLVLLEALALLRARGIAFAATFAGAVHDRDFLASFDAEIRRHGLERHVEYIGPAYGDDKHRLFDEHDVFVHPTCNDAFPLAILEAMHAGLPVVSTRVGAVPEIIDDGNTGLLVPPRDPGALAACLAALVADPSRGHRIGANGRARALEIYTQVSFEQKLAAALATCIASARAAP